MAVLVSVATFSADARGHVPAGDFALRADAGNDEGCEGMVLLVSCQPDMCSMVSHRAWCDCFSTSYVTGDPTILLQTSGASDKDRYSLLRIAIPINLPTNLNISKDKWSAAAGLGTHASRIVPTF